MFSNALIGFLVGISAAAWVFNKMQHSNGNQTKNSLLVAGMAAVAIFAAVVIILGIIIK
jgi:hypothetical protein